MIFISEMFVEDVYALILLCAVDGCFVFQGYSAISAKFVARKQVKPVLAVAAVAAIAIAIILAVAFSQTI